METSIYALVFLSGVLVIILWKLLKKKELSKENREAFLKKKFALQDGITFFDSPMSPCARRVRETLKIKDIEHNVVNVSLERRENRHPSFLAINPLGKVPSMVVHNVKGIPDCYLYESNAITEWLDEQFPETEQLYPSDPWERTQAKMWQQWEGAMTEDFWPLMYSNMGGFFFRFRYTRKAFLKSLTQYESDPYQVAKMTKTYDDEILSTREKKRNALRLFKWIDILERALQNHTYVCGDKFTTADISVIPRTLMYPMLGLLETREEKNRYPNLERYLNDVVPHLSYKGAVAVKFATMIPWMVIEWIGYWRSGKMVHRVHGKDVLKELVKIKKFVKPLLNPVSKHLNLVLYSHVAQYGSMAVRIACKELGIKARIKEVNVNHLEHKTEKYLALNPCGDLPTALYHDHVIYGYMCMIEYLDAEFSTDIISLLPSDPVHRVRVRMWQGWCNTCHNYKLVHIYKQLVTAPILKSEFSTKEELMSTLRESTTAEEEIDDLVHLFEQEISKEEIKLKVNPYREGLRTYLEYLDGELKDRRYLVASQLTTADITVFALLSLFKWVGIDIEDGQWANVSAWREFLLTYPAFSEAQEEIDTYMVEHGLSSY